MNRTAAFRLLPARYAEALAFEANGHDAADIARRLGIEVMSVRPLLAVARANLAALEGRNAPNPADAEGQAGGDAAKPGQTMPKGTN